MKKPEQRQLPAAIGVLQTEGPLGARAQAVIRKLVEAGRLDIARAAVCHVLLEQGMAAGVVPKNAGILHSDLRDSARAHLMARAVTYQVGGGYLCLRALKPRDLADTMLEAWEAGFAAPIPCSAPLSSLPPDEFSSRFSVAVQSLRRSMDKLAARDLVKKKAGYTIPAENLETVLKEMARVVLCSFDAPNEANHALLHPPVAKTS